MPATTTLQAISAGYLVERVNPDTGDARAPVTMHVHSRFRRALNLHAPDGALLTLLGAHAGDFPTGVRTVLPAHWDWRSQAFDGMPVVLHGGSLRSPGWEIDLHNATIWQPRALSGVLDLAAQWRLSVLHVRAARRLRAHAASRAWCGHQLEWLPQWPCGSRAVALGPQHDGPALAHEVGALIGYGAGLTPEGDDYLLGYLAALWPWRGERAVQAHRQAVAEAVQRRLHTTTDISRHYLQLAVAGHFSEPVVALLSAFAANAAHVSILPHVDAVLRFGATSGADTLAGMLHGIRTLQAIARDASPVRARAINRSAGIGEICTPHPMRQP